jgi:hypothetical protein
MKVGWVALDSYPEGAFGRGKLFRPINEGLRLYRRNNDVPQLASKDRPPDGLSSGQNVLIREEISLDWGLGFDIWHTSHRLNDLRRPSDV